MKFLESLFSRVPHPTPSKDDEEMEEVRRRQANIRARLAALDTKVSVTTHKEYKGGVVNAKLRQSHHL